MDTGSAFKSKIWGWAECFLGKASLNSKTLGVLNYCTHTAESG